MTASTKLAKCFHEFPPSLRFFSAICFISNTLSLIPPSANRESIFPLISSSVKIRLHPHQVSNQFSKYHIFTFHWGTGQHSMASIRREPHCSSLRWLNSNHRMDGLAPFVVVPNSPSYLFHPLFFKSNWVCSIWPIHVICPNNPQKWPAWQFKLMG